MYITDSAPKKHLIVAILITVTLLTINTYAAKLVAAWDFEDAGLGGYTEDVSGYAEPLDAILGSASVIYDTQRNGYVLNPSAGGAKCGTNAKMYTSGAFSIQYWMKQQNPDEQWKYLFGCGGGGPRTFNMNGGMLCAVQTSDSSWNPLNYWAPSWPDPQIWHHIVATYDGQYLKGYIDGTLVAQVYRGGTVNPLGNQLWSIGEQWNGDYNGSWAGNQTTAILDDVAYWHGALSHAEVTNIYNGTTDIFGNANTARIEDVGFHGVYKGTYWSEEDVTDDNGGTAFIFVKNNGNSAITLNTININGTNINDLKNNGTLRWYRLWPQTIQPGDVSCITAKALGYPLQENNTISVDIYTSAGEHLSGNYQLKTPEMRIGSVELSPDRKTVYIYLRNVGTENYTINSVYLDDNVTAQTQFVGSNVLVSKGVKILKVQYTTPRDLIDHYMVKIKAFMNGSVPVNVSAPIRLTESSFAYGNWSTSVGTDEPTRQYFRRLHGNLHWGVPFEEEMAENYSEYFIQGSFGAIDNGTINTQTVIRNRNNPALAAWDVAQEPSLSGYPSSQALDDNQTYWAYDPTNPTHILLNFERTYNDYGQIPDIIAMDHYTMYSAPNSIPGTWVPGPFGRGAASMREAIDYTLALKRNTEPKRMWAWCQLAANGTWSYQPTDWGVNMQFWTHLATGAKGILWFIYEQNYQNTFPDLINESIRLTRELAHVKDLVLYGDISDSVWTSTGDVFARMIVSEQAIVVILVNYNYNVSFNLTEPMWRYSLNSTQGQIGFDVPDWIPIEQVYRVTEHNTQNVPYSLSGRHVTIDFDIYNRSYVYVIGKTDSTPPENPVGVQIAQEISPSQKIISWKQANDNYGVSDYRIYRNGQHIGDTKDLIYQDNSSFSGATYSVKAIDSAGNISSSYIQDQIDAASNGQTIIIPPGTYNENITFKGKAITLSSQNPDLTSVVNATVISGQGNGPTVSFVSGENGTSKITGFKITNGTEGIYCGSTSPTIEKCSISGNLGNGISLTSSAVPTINNCLIADNAANGINGGRPYIYNSTIANNNQYGLVPNIVVMYNSIVWGNASGQILGSGAVNYSNIQNGYSGYANLNADPYFANPIAGDYHLKSQYGRFDPAASTWVYDSVTSPSIDRANPGQPLGSEPANQYNKRANQGTYGTSPEASLPGPDSAKAGDINNSGTVDMTDLKYMATKWLQTNCLNFADLTKDCSVDFADYAQLANDWLE